MGFTPVKTRDQFLYWSEPYHSYYTVNGNSSTPVTTGATGTLYAHRESQGLQGWKEIIKRGSNATTPLSAYRDYVEVTERGNVWHVINDWGDDRRGYASGIPQVFLPARPDLTLSVEAARSQAASEFYKKVRAHQTRFEGGVFLGELGEAIRMLKSPAKRLFDEIHRYLFGLEARRRKINGRTFRTKEARRRVLSNILSDTWLEYSFGWSPFVKDLDDLKKAIELMTLDTPRVMIRAVGFDESGPQTSTADGAYGGYYMPIKRHVVTTQQVIVKYYGVLESVRASDRDWQPVFGANLLNFVPTVYELLPWSFLVDYFVNVNEVISSTFTDTSNLKWSSKTIIRKATSRAYGRLDRQKFAENYPNATNVYEGTLPMLERTYREVTRDPSPGQIAPPQFRVKLPGRPQQWLNMLTLAATRKFLEPYI